MAAEQRPVILLGRFANRSTRFLICGEAAAFIRVNKRARHAIRSNVTAECFRIEALRALDYEEYLTQRVSNRICLSHHLPALTSHGLYNP